MNKGEVWFVEFPLEEDPTRILNNQSEIPLALADGMNDGE